MEFVNHRLIKEKTLEKRNYQESIFKAAVDKDILVVMIQSCYKTVSLLI
jgi:ERCC4-related helicase